jgi:hypothetical protein
MNTMMVKTTLALFTIVAIMSGCGQPADSAQPTVNVVADAAPADMNLETKAKGIVDKLAAGNFADVVSTFDATMKAVLSEAALRDTWTSLLQQTGPFQNQGNVRTTTEQGFEVVYVECVFERSKLNAKMVFSKTGEVTGLFLQAA